MEEENGYCPNSGRLKPTRGGGKDRYLASDGLGVGKGQEHTKGKKPKGNSQSLRSGLQRTICGANARIDTGERKVHMNELKIFNYSDKQVRTLLEDNQPWWVLKDVCDILQLTTPTRVAERLEDDEVSLTHITDNLGRKQETLIINESGLYNVILRSDKPEAKPFRKWVTGEVLPTIRKTGGYVGNDEMFITTY